VSDRKKRIVDNRERPAQPEPWEDEAVEKPPAVREGSRSESAKEKRQREPKA
jgi:hypothetical protein